MQQCRAYHASLCTASSVCSSQQAVHCWWEAHKSYVALQVAARRAEAVKWQQMQQAHSTLQSQQDQLVAEIQEWKARYRDEAAYSSELQAAANRLQSELTAAHLESQVPSLPIPAPPPLFFFFHSMVYPSIHARMLGHSFLNLVSVHPSIHLLMTKMVLLRGGHHTALSSPLYVRESKIHLKEHKPFMVAY